MEENRELRRVDEILRKTFTYLARAELARGGDDGIRRRPSGGARGRADPQGVGPSEGPGQLNREGIPAARCTVERLMREEGFRGGTRLRRFRRTSEPVETAARRLDLVNRGFSAE